MSTFHRSQWALDGMVVAYVAQTTQNTSCSDRLRLSAWHADRAINGGLVQLLANIAIIVTLGMTLVYGGSRLSSRKGTRSRAYLNSFIALGQGNVDGIAWPVIISLVVFVLGSLYLLVSVTG